MAQHLDGMHEYAPLFLPLGAMGFLRQHTESLCVHGPCFPLAGSTGPAAGATAVQHAWLNHAADH